MLSTTYGNALRARLRSVHIVTTCRRGVQCFDHVVEVFRAQVSIAQRGLDVGVAHVLADAGEVDAGLGQPGGGGVAQRDCSD